MNLSSFQMSNEFYCKFCDITCTGKAPFEQHLISAKHMKKAKLTESQPSPEPSTSTNPYSSSSTTYRPTVSSKINAANSEDSSISSPPITISPETMRILLEWNHPAGCKPYCDICQLPLHGESNAEIHFQSDNVLHNQKLAVWKQIQENDARYSCKTCCEIFTNENSLRDHYNSESQGSSSLTFLFITCESFS